jgi:hypothetical protein
LELFVVVAQLILAVAGVYAAVGLIFAVAFVLLGVHKFDVAAHGASPGFRLLMLPGCAALWPVMAVKWLRRRRLGNV